jgi:hypothetical protein
MKKGALGLSVNAIIVIILSIVLFSAGISLMFKFISTGEETQDLLNDQIISAIEGRLIQQNKLVALPFNSAILEAQDSKVFGIGFRNIEEKADFTVIVDLSAGSPMQGVDAPDWFLYDTTPIILDENEIGNLALRVQVPLDAELGKYIFNVEIVTLGAVVGTDRIEYTNYGPRQKINIEVR